MQPRGSSSVRDDMMSDVRKEMASLGEANVLADKFWGAQTQRSLDHFSMGKDLSARNDPGLRDPESRFQRPW